MDRTHQRVAQLHLVKDTEAPPTSFVSPLEREHFKPATTKDVKEEKKEIRREDEGAGRRPLLNIGGFKWLVVLGQRQKRRKD